MTTFIRKEDATRNPVRLWTSETATARPFSLLQATQSITRTVPDHLPYGSTSRDFARAHQPRMMLFLLSYCYARGIYKSSDIERLVLTDAVLHRCCGDESPTAQELRHFRTGNREAVHSCLTAALRHLAGEKLAAGIVTKASEAQVAAEANRRIITAMFVDAMEIEADPADSAPTELCYLFANQRGARH